MQQSHLPADDSRAIVFATTADGLRLPVIDVTHPAFAIADDAASLAARFEAFADWDRRNDRVPGTVTWLLIWLAARRSPLLRKILASDNGYLDSISTYMLKLGADHLPPGFDGPMDRKVAAAPHMALVRLRMQQIARLLADALLRSARRRAGRAAQSRQHRGRPGARQHQRADHARARARDADRPSDRDPCVRCAAGRADLRRPRAACAHRARGAAARDRCPVPTPRLRLERHRAARAPACRPRRAGAIIAASSEGGLFEYGTDDAIVANLTALARAGVPIVAGSVTSSSEVRKRMIAQTRFRLFARGLEGFAPLAERKRLCDRREPHGHRERAGAAAPARPPGSRCGPVILHVRRH